MTLDLFYNHGFKFWNALVGANNNKWKQYLKVEKVEDSLGKYENMGKKYFFSILGGAPH